MLSHWALCLTESHLVYQVGKQILDLKSAGLHYNLAPLADINNNPNNPVIGYRSFGENKEKVAQFALEYCGLMMQRFRLFEAFSWTWQYQCRFSFRITCFKRNVRTIT
jgi:hypothetical protein